MSRLAGFGNKCYSNNTVLYRQAGRVVAAERVRRCAVILVQTDALVAAVAKMRSCAVQGDHDDHSVQNAREFLAICAGRASLERFHVRYLCSG